MNGLGVTVAVPRGWDGRIVGRAPEGGATAATVGEAPPPNTAVVHVASFPLPTEFGDFGSGVVGSMTSRDVFVCLFEYAPESVGTPLFAAQGLPRLKPNDFSPSCLRTMIPGHSGVQRFFTVNGRAFSLYAVLGSHTRRIGLTGLVQDVLRSLTIS